jgi:branched-chain amino acid transport system permease protein
MSPELQDILVTILIYGIATLGLDLIVGYTRIFSVNQGLLFGVGAFSYAVTTQHLHTSSILVAWLIAIVVAAGLSAVIALISLRVKGDYFIVASFSAQLIGLQVLFNWNSVSGGPSGTYGLPFPSVFGWSPSSVGSYLWLALIVAAILYLLSGFLLISPYGRLLKALGNDERALSAAGFSPRILQLGAFVLGGAFAGIAGVLYAGYIGIAYANDFSITFSISLLAMVIVGGAGRIVGGLLGAALLVLIPRLLADLELSSATSGSIQQAVFGGMLLLIVLFLPTGLTGGGASLWRWVRSRLASGRGTEVPAQGVERA